MNNGKNQPTIQVSVCFAPGIYVLCGESERNNSKLRVAIEDELNLFFNEMGIPGAAKVDFTQNTFFQEEDNQFFYLLVNDTEIRLSDDAIQGIYAYVTNELPNTAQTLAAIAQWIEEIILQYGENTPEFSVLLEFFRLVCRYSLQEQPQVLVSPLQADAYLELLQLQFKESTDDASAPIIASTWLQDVMGQVVEMGISLRNFDQVAHSIRANCNASAEIAAESLIAELMSNVIEIHLSEATLRDRTLDEEAVEKMKENFPFMRDGLFEELGIVYPDFHFYVNEAVRQNAYMLKINNLFAIPQLCIQRGECMVNDSIERLKLMNIEGVTAKVPGQNYKGSVTNSVLKEQLESVGLTTWDYHGHLILSISATLRRYSFRFVDKKAAEKALNGIKDFFPALLETVKAEYSFEQITSIFRRLVAEGQSIRNLRAILERMLDYPFAFDDALRFLVLDDRPNSHGKLELISEEGGQRLLAFVRSGLKNQISYKIARGTFTLVVYLLDGKIESVLAERWTTNVFEKDDFAEVKRHYRKENNAIIRAIRSEMMHLPPSAQVPSILTTLEVRPLLRQLLQYELPQLSVIAYEELMHSMNIQPVARISVDLESA
jgi:flagellar biosynthesis component FlhA